MSEENKIHCCQCGKTIAVETETEIQIKCTGKHDGKKCGCVNSINKGTISPTYCDTCEYRSFGVCIECQLVPKSENRAYQARQKQIQDYYLIKKN